MSTLPPPIPPRQRGSSGAPDLSGAAPPTADASSRTGDVYGGYSSVSVSSTGSGTATASAQRDGDVLSARVSTLGIEQPAAAAPAWSIPPPVPSAYPDITSGRAPPPLPHQLSGALSAAADASGPPPVPPHPAPSSDMLRVPTPTPPERVPSPAPAGGVVPPAAVGSVPPPIPARPPPIPPRPTISPRQSVSAAAGAEPQAGHAQPPPLPTAAAVDAPTAPANSSGSAVPPPLPSSQPPPLPAASAAAAAAPASAVATPASVDLSDPPAPVVSEPTYLVSKKVSVQELLEKDAADASLAKYKAQLLGSPSASAGAGAGASVGSGETPTAKYPSDPRLVILREMRVESEGRPPIVVDLTDLSSTRGGAGDRRPYTLKEGVSFSLVLSFYVQHDLVHGLRWTNTVRKYGLQVDQSSEMLGSFAPSPRLITHRLPEEDAPSGMLARGSFTAKAKITDDDGRTHAEFEYAFELKKNW